MFRTHNCGELRISDANKEVTLSGWVQKIRNLGGMTFVDLRDRYGLTQIAFNIDTDAQLCEDARKLGREFVVKVIGTVNERESKNAKMSTGDIEIVASSFEILSKSEVPPFTIEDETDGGEEIRMKYRYLDLRREPVRKGIILRSKMAQEIRHYLSEGDFIEVETPTLIKSTPEGARDFIVPSRLNAGYFYALPQSPQVFKQLLMISGFDKYFQIVKCFRDEDFRADRQPEFTQLDCEMSFVERDDILNKFEGLTKHLFQKFVNFTYEGDFPRMTYADAMKYYGSDKPDIRFEMKFHEITEIAQGQNFKIFDEAEYVGGICAEGCGTYSRKQLDKLVDFVRKPQIGAKGLVYVKCNADGSYKSSADKFFSQEQLTLWAKEFGAKPGDLILVLSGDKTKTQKMLNELRLEMGERLGLRDKNKFAPLWVVDFPLFEKDEETGQLHAMHHPFTSPLKSDMHLLESDPESVNANAYDLIINGVEIGGGSVRIYDTEMQQQMFKHLGFTKEEADAQFGFLMEAFSYGAPPHAGIAFGFDRWAAMFNGTESIRNVIAFPKNNSGKDVMIDAPSLIDTKQLEDLQLKVDEK